MLTDPEHRPTCQVLSHDQRSWQVLGCQRQKAIRPAMHDAFHDHLHRDELFRMVHSLDGHTFLGC